MGGIADAFAQAFREYVTDGVPASGPWKPVKADIKAIGTLLDTIVSAAGGNMLSYASVSLMNANTTAANGQLAYVYNNNGSPADAANGVYQRNTGTSSWVAATWYFNVITQVGAPVIASAQAARDLAKDWASKTPGSDVDTVNYPGLKSARSYAGDAATSAAALAAKGPLATPKTAALRRHAGNNENISGFTNNGDGTFTALVNVYGYTYIVLSKPELDAIAAGTPITSIVEVVSGTPTIANMYQRNASNSTVATNNLLPTENSNPILRNIVFDTTTKQCLFEMRSTTGSLVIRRPALAIGEPAKVATEPLLLGLRGYRDKLLNRAVFPALSAFAMDNVSGSAATYSSGAYSIPAGSSNAIKFDVPFTTGDVGTVQFRMTNAAALVGLSLNARLVGADGSNGDFNGVPATLELIDDVLGLYEGHFIAAPHSGGQAMRGLRMTINNPQAGAGIVTVDNIVVAKADTIPPFSEMPQVAKDYVAAQLAAYVPTGLAPLPIYEGEENLRTFRSKRERILGNYFGYGSDGYPSGSMVDAAIGDSFTAAGRYVDMVQAELKTRFGNGGIGWCPAAYALSAAYNTQASIPGDYLPRSGTGWAANTTAYTGRGPDLTELTSSTAGDRLTGSWGAAACKVTLLYLKKSGGGSFRYSLDGAATWVATVSTANGSDALGLLSSLTVPGGGSLIIEVVSGSVTIFGADHRLNVVGYVMHRLGQSSSRTLDWNNASALWEAGIAALGIDHASIMHGTNDQSIPITPATMYTQKTTLVGRLRTAIPTIDITLFTPNENMNGRATQMSDYAAQDRQVARDLGLAFINGPGLLGPTSGYLARSLYISGDTTHPVAPGYALLAAGRVAMMVR